ncbi:TetR/AcrR family transcriptional regulator [Gordonia sp. NPDC003504]
MPGVNSASRGYDSSRRRERARETRRRIVAAATKAFERDGFAATIADIAREAEVSPETVYKGFDGKAGLLKEAFDQAIAGDDKPVPIAERPETAVIDAEPDARTKIRMYASVGTERAARVSRLMPVIRAGAAQEPKLARLYDELLGQRLAGMTALATTLMSTGEVRSGITVEHARDVLWTLIAPEVFDMLVIQRGWSLEDYQEWLIRSMTAELL